MHWTSGSQIAYEIEALKHHPNEGGSAGQGQSLPCFPVHGW